MSIWKMLRLLIGDVVCYYRHVHDWLEDGYHVCLTCSREWKGDLVVSRSWQADCEALADEDAEEGTAVPQEAAWEAYGLNGNGEDQ